MATQTLDGRRFRAARAPHGSGFSFLALVAMIMLTSHFSQCLAKGPLDQIKEGDPDLYVARTKSDLIDAKQLADYFRAKAEFMDVANNMSRTLGIIMKTDKTPGGVQSINFKQSICPVLVDNINEFRRAYSALTETEHYTRLKDQELFQAKFSPIRDFAKSTVQNASRIAASLDPEGAGDMHWRRKPGEESSEYGALASDVNNSIAKFSDGAVSNIDRWVGRDGRNPTMMVAVDPKGEGIPTKIKNNSLTVNIDGTSFALFSVQKSPLASLSGRMADWLTPLDKGDATPTLALGSGSEGPEPAVPDVGPEVPKIIVPEDPVIVPTEPPDIPIPLDGGGEIGEAGSGLLEVIVEAIGSCL